MQISVKHTYLPAILSAAVAATLPTTTFAQLEEVLVTAERREASVQDVPIAVSAYNEDMIDKLQIDDTLDLITVVPNMFGGNNTGLGTAIMYYLRAQGNDESISTFDPPVGTYVDDVYITRQNVNNVALFDVERIEVLRGPQGTLYGRNTTGGAISVVMKKPSDTMQGYVEAGAGRFGKTLLRGSIDLPLSENVLTKFSAYYVDDDGTGCGKEQKLLNSYILGFITLAFAIFGPPFFFIRGHQDSTARRLRRWCAGLIVWMRRETVLATKLRYSIFKKRDSGLFCYYHMGYILSIRGRRS